MDAETGRILYEKNPDVKLPPASTTKVMTAIIALERLPFGADVIPSKKAVYVEPTVAGLKEGVTYKLEDLLKAILIKSANDAAVVIAERVAGSEKEFAVMMNDKAAQIGMENTYFASASGLPSGKKDTQYTTARDLAKMMRYAMRHKEILEYMSQKEASFSGSDGANIYLKSHNKALSLFEDAPWGKTGYTKQASRTFVGVDPSSKPTIVFSLLKSEDLWGDVMKLKREGLLAWEKSHRSWRGDLRDSFLSLFGWIKGDKGAKNGSIQGMYSTSISTAPAEAPKKAVTQKKHKRHKKKRAKKPVAAAKKK
jgi:D-alanyl-D-alanine carboxypeptidase